MIGSAKVTYTNDNVCDLVRKDLVDKFGNRELANYNLYLPGVVRTKAVVDKLPNPDVHVISVEQQIKDMGIYPKQPVLRNPDSVHAVAGMFDAPISSTFDYRNRNLIVTGGPVLWTTPEDSGMPYAAHWYGIAIQFPVGIDFDENDIIPFTLNGDPQFHTVTDAESSNGEIVVIVDAKYTTMNFLIHWADNYAPESIKTTCTASLESRAVDKIPAFPTEPKFEFIYPESYVVDSNVQVDVDLDMGKN